MAKDNEIKLGIEIDQAAQQRVTQAVNTLENNMRSLETSTINATNAAQQYETRVKGALDSTGKAAASNEAAIKKLREEYIKAADAAGQFQQKSSSGDGFNINVEGLRRTGGALNQLGLGVIGTPVSRIGDVAQVVKELQGVSSGLTTVGAAGAAAEGGLVATATALAPIAVVGAAVGIALLGVNKGLEALDSSTAVATSGLGRVSRTLEQFDKITSGTGDDAIKSLSDNQKQIASLQRERDRLKGSLDKTFTDLQQKNGDALARVQLSRDKQYNEDVQKLKDIEQKILDLQSLSNDAFTAVKDGSTSAADAELEQKKAADALADSLKKAAAQQKFYNDTVANQQEQKRQDFATNLKKEQDAETKRIAGIADIQKKYNDSVKSINESADQQQLSLQQKYADRLVEIAQKAVDDSESALQKLEDKRAELLLNSSREEEKAQRQADFDDLTAQIQEQRKERDTLVEHLRKLRDIQKSFQSQERDALLERNFLQLFQIQENKKEQTKAEDQAYENKKQDLQQQLNDDRQQTLRQREFERNERRIALQQQLADQQAAYQVELKLIQTNKQKQLQLAQNVYNNELSQLASKTQRELQIKYQGYTQELMLANLGAQQRVKVEAATQAALLAQARATLAALGVQSNTGSSAYSSAMGDPIFRQSGGVRQFANGGYASPNRWIEVNEPGSSRNESFDGLRFPGRGLFMPFRGGTVNPNSSSGPSVIINQHITGSDPRQIAAAASQRAMDVFRTVTR